MKIIDFRIILIQKKMNQFIFKLNLKKCRYIFLDILIFIVKIMRLKNQKLEYRNDLNEYIRVYMFKINF